MKALHQVYFTRCTQTRCRWYLECTIELEALIQTGETSYGINSHWSIRNIVINILILCLHMIHQGKCWLSKRLFFIQVTSTQAIPMTLHCSRWSFKKISSIFISIFSNYQENTINNSFLSLQFTKLAESVDLDVWSPACLPDQVSKFVCFPCT